MSGRPGSEDGASGRGGRIALAGLIWLPGIVWTLRWAVFPDSGGWDRDIYCAAQQALAQGQDAYDPAVIGAHGAWALPVLYSPLVLAILPACAKVSYAALQVALIAVTVVSLRAAGVPLRVAGPLLLCPMLGIGADVRVGNVTLLELAFVAGGVLALSLARGRLLGAAIACAGFVKVLPLSFAAGLAATRSSAPGRWRTVSACVATLSALVAASFALDPVVSRRWLALLWSPPSTTLGAMFDDRPHIFGHGLLPLLRSLLGMDAGTIGYALVTPVVAAMVLVRVRRSALDDAARFCLVAACLVPLWPRVKMYTHLLALPWLALVLVRLDAARRDRVLLALGWGALALYVLVLPARVAYERGGAYAAFAANVQWVALVATLAWILAFELPRLGLREPERR